MPGQIKLKSRVEIRVITQVKSKYRISLEKKGSPRMKIL